uniref:SGNH hydrolase-type esterase domain-containing protein n=1 Tax=Cacopsylla melanoneura TaxID=428564 RepID=A0A8D8R322_9HEMI
MLTNMDLRYSRKYPSSRAANLNRATVSSGSTKRGRVTTGTAKTQVPTKPTPPPSHPSSRYGISVTSGKKPAGAPLKVSNLKSKSVTQTVRQSTSLIPSTRASIPQNYKSTPRESISGLGVKGTKDACVETEDYSLFVMSLIDNIQNREQQIRELNRKIRDLNEDIESLQKMHFMINPPCPNCCPSPVALTCPNPAPEVITSQVSHLTGPAIPAPPTVSLPANYNLVTRVSAKPSVVVPIPTPIGFSSESKRRLLVVGDSMSRDLGKVLQNLLPKYQVTCYTYPGATFAEVVGNLPVLASSFTKKDYVIIQGGTNDVPHFYPSYISEVLQCIKDVCDKSNVIMSTVPYMYHKEGKGWNSNIFASNQYLIRMSRNFGFYLFNCNYILSRTMYTRHGLHLNQRGKRTMCENLRNLIVLDLDLDSNVGLVSNNKTVFLCDVSFPLVDSSSSITNHNVTCLRNPAALLSSSHSVSSSSTVPSHIFDKSDCTTNTTIHTSTPLQSSHGSQPLLHSVHPPSSRIPTLPVSADSTAVNADFFQDGGSPIIS